MGYHPSLGKIQHHNGEFTMVTQAQASDNGESIPVTPMAMARSRSPKGKAGRTWVFTINNYTEEHLEWVKGLECVKIVASKELGDQGTPHVQGAVTLKRQYTLKQLKKLCNEAHWELAKAKQDFNYCKKSGGEIIRDEDHKQQGKRTDLDAVRKSLKEGAALSDIAETCSSLQEIQFAEKYIKYTQVPLPKGTRVDIHWYYGCTGTGKTKAVLDQCDPYIPLSHKWWEGYQGQDNVLLDDLRPDWCKPAELLRLLDPYRYQYKVEVKGGSLQLLATKIWVTCPWHPNDFWKDSDEDPKQLIRRIKELLHFRADGAWQQPSGHS